MKRCDRGNHIFEPGYECCRAAAPASEAIQKAGIAAFYDYLDALPDDRSRPVAWPYSPGHITNALLDCINAVVGAESPSAPREPRIEVAECGGQWVVYLYADWYKAPGQWWFAPGGGKDFAESLAKLLRETLRSYRGGSVPSAPREASAHLLQLIADYGKANFECGNRFSDDPDVNAGANDRANEVWLAILDAVGAVDRGAPSPALDWQKIADEFCAFNPAADRVVMHNFAGWLVSRGAPSAPTAPDTKLRDLMDEIIENYWDYIENGGPHARTLLRDYRQLRWGSTPELEGNPPSSV